MLLTCVLMTSSALSQATPIVNAFSGLASPAYTITFDEHVFPVNTLITNQYADVGVTFSPYLKYSPQTGFPNIVGNDVGNFSPGPDPVQFIMQFVAPQSAVAFAMVSNGTQWTFEALSGNTVIESFTAAVGTGANDFFGFTGINFDGIRVSSLQNDFMLIDNIQLSNNALPAPAAALLLLAGLLGMGGVRRLNA